MVNPLEYVGQSTKKSKPQPAFTQAEVVFDRERYCRDEGPSNARIILVGEAPGKTEIELRRPFVGWSGNLLKRWWANLFPSSSSIVPAPPSHYPQNIERRDIYITNLLPYLPSTIESVPPSELYHWRAELWNRLRALPEAVVVVPVGNYACWALAGKGNVSQLRKEINKEDQVGITQSRGSIYSSMLTPDRILKVIPTLHPAFVLRSGEGGRPGRTNSVLEKHCIRDWQRILYESSFPEIREPIRHHILDPYEEEVEAWTREVLSDPKQQISCDIETWGNTLSCVGFAASNVESICIPTASKAQFKTFAPYVAKLTSSPNPKIMQNGNYDYYWLRWYGFSVNNYMWDTLAMHHALDATDRHDLAYLCSYYLPFYRFWKDEAKGADEIIKCASNQEQLWRYNGQDCCNTYELWSYLLAELSREGMLSFYLKHYQEMFLPICETMLHGIRIDENVRRETQKQFKKECADIREELKEIAGGIDLFANKDFSRVKLLDFFKNTLKVPVITKKTKKKDGTKSPSESLDNIALAKYAHKYPEKCKDVVSLIIQHRSKSKILSTWLEKKSYDRDGRVRSTYGFNTEAGRLNSKKNPRRTGYNGQNTKREIRKLYLPDIFIRKDLRDIGLLLEVDLSQAEDRVCKMYCNCTGKAERMVELANRHPTAYDVHRHNASIIFDKPEHEISKYPERFLGKIVAHGSQRGLTGRKLSDKLLAENDMIVNPADCQKMIDKILGALWEIPTYYWAWVREQLMEKQELRNTWGRRWRHTGNLDDDVYRKAYSFPMQSEIADIMNQWGFIPLYNWLKDTHKRSRINIQRHDALVISVPFNECYTVARWLTDSLERPREYFGCFMTVPATTKVGSNDKNGIEFDLLPNKEEFEERVRKFVVEKWSEFK